MCYKNYISFIILFILPVLLFSQDINITSITTEDGLSQGMIFDIAKDKDDFMWFATKNGLNRYDGYDFKVFTHNPFDSLSISGDAITGILEDSKGRFWICTESDGLNYFDREKEIFYPIKINGEASDYFHSGAKSHGTMLEDKYGNIWVRQKNRVLRIEVADFEQQIHTSFPAIIFSKKFIRLINGEIWASDYHSVGVARWDEEAQEFKPIPKFENTTIRKLIFHAFPSPQIWTYDKDNFYKIYEDSTIAFPIKDVTESKAIEGKLRGVNRINYNATLQKYVFNVGANPKFYSLSFNALGEAEISDLFTSQDESYVSHSYFKDETIWLGTGGFGIRKIDIKPTLFRHLIPNRSIKRIYPSWDENKMIVFEPRPVLLDNQTEKFSPLTEQKKAFPKTVSILKSINKGYWAGGYYPLQDRAKGSVLLKLNEDFTIIKHYEDGSFKKDNGFMFLQEDATGNIWYPLNNNDFGKLDIQTDSLVHVDCHQFGTSTAKGYTQCLYLDGQNSLWKGTTSGLTRLILDENKKPVDCQFFQNVPNDRTSLRHNSVACCLDDPTAPSTYLWVATKGGGLNKLNKQTGRFEHFTVEDGLPNNVVYGILSDEAGKLWLSTNKGLSQFDPIQESFKNYRANDGLQNDEFNTWSYYKNEVTGELFFGGIAGLTAFFPKDIQLNETKPNVVITDFKIHNETVNVGKSLKERGENPLTKAIQYTQKIDLAWHQNQLTFKFAALDFDAPEKNQYKFKLLGVNQDWVTADKSRIANYSNLGSGSYVFEVKGSNSSGVWNEETARLEIIIHPPWWRTWWAYATYVALSILAIFQIYQFQIRREKLRNQLLFEQKEAERLAEVDKMKTNFFTNITHEFRTPLTLIIEPLRQIIENPKDNLLDKAKIAKSNSQKLLGLINQLLDLSKLEHQKMQLDLAHGNILEVTNQIVAAFRPMAEKKGIALKYAAPKTLADSDFDKDKVEKVLTNLLSNAFKFTPKGGEVSLTLDFPDFGNLENLRFVIKDTGIGISKENQTNIFDRFFQVDASTTRKGEGTGIGLALTKELTELMNGKIEVKSELGKGTEFTVVLPMIYQAENVKDFENLSHLESPVLGGNSKLPPKFQLDTKEIKSEGNLKLPPDKNLESSNIALIIEDNEELRGFIKSSIQNNYQVLEAQNGKEGVEIALKTIPDIIISDVMMPEMDGFEVCKMLKTDAKTSHIPIILLTGKTAVESKIQGLQFGADAYMNKPFHTKELLVRMSNLIEIRQKLQAKFNQPLALTQTKLSETNISKIDIEFLENVKTIIKENLTNEDLSVEILAEKVYLSRSQLFRKVKALTNQTPVEFIRNYRLDRAMEILKEGDSKIIQVAFSVGFSNEKYFSRSFKKRFGTLPSAVK